MIHFGLPAYVGPGAGFAFLGSLLSLISAVAAAIVSVLIWPFRMAWRAIVRPHRGRFSRAVFLGFDGLDPAIVETLMAQGKLPNLARLSETGSYRRLRTTFPPSSVVAWATFATGVNPAKHNVFDDSRIPDRKGESFWKILGSQAVKSTILLVPGASRPDVFNGRQLCATDAERPRGLKQLTSHPRIYATYLEKLLGLTCSAGLSACDPTAGPKAPSQAEACATMGRREYGFREDSWPARSMAAGENAFRECEAIFANALETTPRGVVACVFQTPISDRQSGVIERLYAEVDRIVGEVLAQAGSETALFVLSDHGFCTARRSVNLNAWLLREGYLALDGAEIDWARTRAYAPRGSGVYLNLRGREKQGIVNLEDAAALRAELAQKLTGFMDEDGEVAIRSAHKASDLYHGPYLNAGPDIVVGYAAGYCGASQAANGSVSHKIFDNTSGSVRGDDGVDPSLVPGVLFSNLKITADMPGMEDLAPTALTLFGVAAPAWMDGRSVIAAA